MDYNRVSLEAHRKKWGKLATKSKFPLKNKTDLSIAYTPGVGAVAKLIAADPAAVFSHTIKKNSVAVVTDGSAVLGLGNIGPAAALPVMEGKALLFKKFADIDAWPICLDTQDPEEIIAVIKRIAPGFGGINLEDISAPRCFDIENRLNKELTIPVFHDDQHGTAIVVLAALYNALKLIDRDLKTIKIVINGAGAAATAIVNLLLQAGATGNNVLILDRMGIIYRGRPELNNHKKILAEKTNHQKLTGGLKEALAGADVFIGVSASNVLTSKLIDIMAHQPIVFAMANPDPEISLVESKRSKVAVFGTGRSDYPNQINNILAFPGVFRGALDGRLHQITDEMKLAAAYAIARLVNKRELTATYILPDPFDRRVVKAVAKAIQSAF